MTQAAMSKQWKPKQELRSPHPNHKAPEMTVVWESMMALSNRNIFPVSGPMCGNPAVTGGFPSRRPVTWSFDVFFYMHRSKRLCKQSRHRWFETPSRSSWRHYNEIRDLFGSLATKWNDLLVHIKTSPIPIISNVLITVCTLHNVTRTISIEACNRKYKKVSFIFYSQWWADSIRFKIMVHVLKPNQGTIHRNAKFISKNINIYFPFLSFLRADMTQVFEIPLQVRYGLT